MPSRLLDTFASYLFLLKRLIYQRSKNKKRNTDWMTSFSGVFLYCLTQKLSLFDLFNKYGLQGIFILIEINDCTERPLKSSKLQITVGGKSPIQKQASFSSMIFLFISYFCVTNKITTNVIIIPLLKRAFIGEYSHSFPRLT